MRDPRITKLAYNLINYSCGVKKGERILIENTGLQAGFVTALVEETYKAGGEPFVWLREPAVQRALLMGADGKQLTLMAEHDSAFMKNMQCYIGLRAGDNSTETSDVPSSQMEKYATLYGSNVHSKIRVPDTRWCVLRYPTPSMAQSAGMSTEAFEDFYFDVCCLDYQKMGEAMKPLIERMAKADTVRITGPGTDLTMSIKGIPGVACSGDRNIPDGEIYTAPVRESVNGTLQYNTPSLMDGYTYENIRFTFKDGKIVDAAANNTQKINEVLNRDEGARYIGEFSFGVNPYIHVPMKDTLFDEKISGSFHFTPGNCYDEAFNGNKSALHWDLVCIQTPEYGGGEIWFDDELIRKDGRFVPAYLDCLNPENLK